MLSVSLTQKYHFICSVMAFACSNQLNRRCNSDTRYTGAAAAAVAEGGSEASSWRKITMACIAIGAVGCGVAALLACTVSMLSGSSLLRQKPHETQMLASGHGHGTL